MYFILTIYIGLSKDWHNTYTKQWYPESRFKHYRNSYYKITDADINVGSVTNLASATGSFSGQPITLSNGVIETVHYKQPTQFSDGCNNPEEVYQKVLKYYSNFQIQQ